MDVMILKPFGHGEAFGVDDWQVGVKVFQFESKGQSLFLHLRPTGPFEPAEEASFWFSKPRRLAVFRYASENDEMLGRLSDTCFALVLQWWTTLASTEARKLERERERERVPGGVKS